MDRAIEMLAAKVVRTMKLLGAHWLEWLTMEYVVRLWRSSFAGMLETQTRSVLAQYTPWAAASRGLGVDLC